MLIKQSPDIVSSEITDKKHYVNRRAVQREPTAELLAGASGE